MARGRRRQSQTKTQPQESAPAPAPVELNQISLIEYVIQFLVFVVFCGITAGLVILVTGESLGLQFFFGVLILGFFVVCVFSYFHDRLYQDQDDGEGTPPG